MQQLEGPTSYLNVTFFIQKDTAEGAKQICCSRIILKHTEMNRHVVETVLLWFEVPVNDAQTVQVVQGQGQLCKVELHVLLREHHLQHRKPSGCHEEPFKGAAVL